jgi:signal transduction histidine kinase
MAERFAGEAGAVEDLVLVRLEERLRTVLHEIRQPVAAVLALAEAARGLPGITPDMRDYLDLVIEQVQEVSGAAWSVLGRGRAGDLPGSLPVDVDEVLDSVLAAYSRTWTGRLARRGHRGRVWTQGCRPAIRRCLVNVVDNAVRAAGPTGEVVVTVRQRAGSVRLDVEDDGPGFGDVPSGMGIGLAVTRRELQEIGGSLSSGQPSGLGGARVAISLPLRHIGPGLPDPVYLDPSASAG